MGSQEKLEEKRAFLGGLDKWEEEVLATEKDTGAGGAPTASALCQIFRVVTFCTNKIRCRPINSTILFNNYLARCQLGILPWGYKYEQEHPSLQFYKV